MPVFGKRCVCCNADPFGRVQDCDPSTDRIKAPNVPMPVCGPCADHALSEHTGPIIAVCGVCTGLATIGLGILYRSERPDDSLLVGMIVVGILIVATSIGWLVAVARKTKRARVGGHHPGLQFSVGNGATLLDTDNERLVQELVELNPSARRVPTPGLWRTREHVVPPARTLKAPKQDDSEAARLARYVADSRSGAKK